MPRISGYLLIATGVLHTAFGIVTGVPQLADIAGAGIFDAIEPHADRMALFWFLFSGFLMIFSGQILLVASTPVPAAIGLHLLVLSVAGAILIPESGFWFVIPQAVYLLIAGRRTASQRGAAAPQGLRHADADFSDEAALSVKSR